ncbi:MAG: hypothetical protein JSS82_09905 [Bacteroidetes bacterium]|nr:hypothetical protein [Bacteroidota bacterium]
MKEYFHIADYKPDEKMKKAFTPPMNKTELYSFIADSIQSKVPYKMSVEEKNEAIRNIIFMALGREYI